ncbi:serine hydrolase domain-containing protein [Fodinicurvata sp. EGI_FJ10296]|uniref:serine hydrolase domain-containing protein n=1 Tax=Fodinicurvata sp. EGI_FJ10296 TaxID=3231908 RepID=UPI0034512B4F
MTTPSCAEIAADAAAPLRDAVDQGRIPGGTLGIITRDGTSASVSFGRHTIDTSATAVSTATWFDLASLTKVMVTVPAVLRLVSEGRIDLDDPIARHLPTLNQTRPDAPVRALTVRALLTHQSGLAPVEPLYTWAAGATLRQAILQHDWSPGAPAYSDIGYILLGLMIERLTGGLFRSLPVGPGLTFSPPAAETAASEVCNWRGRTLQGEVHDENAWALGGAAGHAGLFGTVDGVLAFALGMMDGTGMNPAALAAMRTPQTDRRALGWERPYPLWTGGSLCSTGTLGHNGFTGTGLWIDFDRGYAWTLLTNRVHPTRHRDTGIMPLRRAVANRLAALIGQSALLPAFQTGKGWA